MTGVVIAFYEREKERKKETVRQNPLKKEREIARIIDRDLLEIKKYQ